jgi:hypothetical protein
MSLPDKAADSIQRKPYTVPRVISYGSVKEIVQGGGGTGLDAGGAHTKTCWVAEALYGVDDPRTTLVRAWVTRQYAEKGRWWMFAALYSRYGRAVANSIYRGRLPRQWVRPLFDFLVNTAFDESARAIKATSR